MKVKCDYCDSYFEDAESHCPNCGAANQHIHRTTADTPRTIDELRDYCNRNGLSPEKTRFFIGVDYQGARAFGIYRNASGECVVYKNKNDGSRVVRYQGMDEAYAVNELYQRLQAEIINQKNHYANEKLQRANAAQTGHAGSGGRRKRRPAGILIVYMLIMIACMFAPLLFMFVQFAGLRRDLTNPDYAYSSVPTGYYYYNDQYYYHSSNSNNSWYYWDDQNDDWQYNSSLYKDFPEDMEDYLESDAYVYNSDYTDFEDSFWYSEPRESTRTESDTDYSYRDDDYSYSNDNDYSSDWSSDDWDSGWSDWDSDW